MALRSDAAFDRGLDVFGEVLEQLGPDDWDKQSPCAGWTALDVLGHLGSSIRMGISIFRGEQPEWPETTQPRELVTGDPVSFWREISAEARDSLAGADLDLVMDTPIGPRTVADRLAFPAIDLFVHAWDIGRAAGIEVVVPDDVIEFTHGYIDPFPTEAVRGPGGAFGPEAAAPAGATPTERFIAWTGRPPRG